SDGTGHQCGQESCISGRRPRVESRRHAAAPRSAASMPLLNNVVEQDHRLVKKRVWLAKGYGSFQSAWRTLQGVEAINMIRKGRGRRLRKGDSLGQAFFIGGLFGIKA